MKRRKRQAQKRDEVRRAILDAARHLFIDGGYANVPIRRVASHLGYSAGALYRYFPTKDDIFNDLAEEGFRLIMAHETLPTCPPDAPPLERLRHFCWGVYDFARIYPEYFYLIFLDRSAPRLKPQSRGLRAIAETAPNLRQVIEDCVAAGALRPGLDIATVHHVLCTAIHGLSAQYVCNRLPEGVEPEAYAHVIVDLAIAGLRAGALDGVRVVPVATGAAGSRTPRRAGHSRRRAQRSNPR